MQKKKSVLLYFFVYLYVGYVCNVLRLYQILWILFYSLIPVIPKINITLFHSFFEIHSNTIVKNFRNAISTLEII